MHIILINGSFLLRIILLIGKWERAHLYLVHVELAATKTLITFDRNKIWGWDLYQSTALVEAAKKIIVKDICKV